jgi:hypothetical protein
MDLTGAMHFQRMEEKNGRRRIRVAGIGEPSAATSCEDELLQSLKKTANL